MQNGFDKQKQIQALEKKIANQRMATRQLDQENKRMMEFLRQLGYDPDQFRYTTEKTG